MIEIKKCEDSAVLARFGIENASDTVVMSAKDGETVFGVAAAKVCGECAYITKIETTDEYKMFEMDFGLGKSILNLLDLSSFLCNCIILWLYLSISLASGSNIASSSPTTAILDLVLYFLEV